MAGWFLADSFRIGQLFWKSRYEKRPCFEFRHGHDGPLGWWIEQQLQNELALLYTLTHGEPIHYDDACGEFTPKPYGTAISLCLLDTIEAEIEWNRKHNEMTGWGRETALGLLARRDYNLRIQRDKPPSLEEAYAAAGKVYPKDVLPLIFGNRM